MDPLITTEALGKTKSSDDVLKNKSGGSIHSIVLNRCNLHPFGKVLCGSDDIYRVGVVCQWIDRSYTVDCPFLKDL